MTSTLPPLYSSAVFHFHNAIFVTFHLSSRYHIEILNAKLDQLIHLCSKRGAEVAGELCKINYQACTQEVGPVSADFNQIFLIKRRIKQLFSDNPNLPLQIRVIEGRNISEKVRFLGRNITNSS